MPKKSNVLGIIGDYLKPNFSSIRRVQEKQNALGMIGDYLNVMRRGRLNNPAGNPYPKKHSISPQTEAMVVINRGERNGNQVSFFPVTEASRKSVSRYNNRQIRRDREFEPVAIQDLRRATISGKSPARGNLRMSGNVLNDGDIYGYIDSSVGSMSISPRRAIQEYRVGQRYANAERVGQVLNRAQQIGRTLAPTIGALGGATIAGMMASRYANNNPVKGKTTSKRSLKKADYFVNGAPSKSPYQSKLRPLTDDEKAIINEPSGLNQRKNVKRSNNQFTPEQQKLRRRIEQEILNTGNFGFSSYDNPSGRNFSSSQMEYSYANPSKMSFERTPYSYASSPKMWSGFNQPSNDWFAQDMALKEMMNRYGTEAFTEDEIRNFEERSGVKINYNPSQVNSNTSSLSYGSRNGMRGSAAMKRMSKRQAVPKPRKYFE